MSDKKKKDDKILICPNPIATSTGGMSADSGNLMPPAIHGGIMQEESQTSQFNCGLSEDEVKDMLDNSPIQNVRFSKGQFTKYFGSDVVWCALNDTSTGNALALACLTMDIPKPGYCFISEIQNLQKGYGKPLFLDIFDKYGKVWFMSNPDAGQDLQDYYDKMYLEKIVVPNSIYGGDVCFYATHDCDMKMLKRHCLEEYTKTVSESLKKESSIDYPVSEGLCPEIWDTSVDGKWLIKPEIKQRALELVDKLLAKYHVEAKGVNVVGSICSNQYTDDGDVDVHIQVDLPEDVAEKLNNLRKKTQD